VLTANIPMIMFPRKKLLKESAEVSGVAISSILGIGAKGSVWGQARPMTI
jgi:hypothetical protein